MKKQVLIGSVLLAAISTFSQTGLLKPKPTGLINTKILMETKFGDIESTPTNIMRTNTAKPELQKPFSAAKSASANNWNKFTASMNIYGVIISYCKPLQWDDDLNAVSFIHRKSPTYNPSPAPSANAANGSIVAMISTNCGTSWDSTAMWVNNTFWARYPGGGIYNPPSNTNMNNAYVVGAGPTTGQGSTTWIGNWYASKQLGSANYNNVVSAVPNAMQSFPTLGPYGPNLGRHDFAAYSFAATDDGKVRTLAGITDDALTADTAVMLVTGTFNTSNTFDWVGTVFDPAMTQASDGTKNWVSRPIMAWNEQGTIGYVVIMGSRLGATRSNMGYQPIVYKTINSGATWSEEAPIDFNNDPSFADVVNRLFSVAADPTLAIPNFWWAEGIDCSVDMNNKLHIFTSMLWHSSPSLDSLNYINQFTTEKYVWPHTPGHQPYLYDFIYNGTSPTPTWSHVLVDSMSSESPAGVSTGAGYNDNPWDTDPTQSNQKVRIDARLQMSRTPDGKYLVYTWAESDTTSTNLQKKWNNIPDIKARAMDVTTGLISPVKINVTSADIGQISGHAMYHFISPKCQLVSDAPVGNQVGPTINIPMTVSNSSPYHQLTTNTHWYSCTALSFRHTGTVSTVGIAENNLNSTNNSFIYPNPAKNNATVSLNLANNSKIQIEVLNTIGQVVRATKADGQTGSNSVNIDLNGLASGIYLVNVKVENAISTKKLIIE
jgi:hypothetical protein